MRYNIITYRLHQVVKPADVLSEIEKLLQKHSAQHKNCLFKAQVPIIEFEFEGKRHSNREKNAIISICKKYPTLEPLVKHSEIDKGKGQIDRELSLCNFSDADHVPIGKMDDSIMRDIVTKIPRPYGVNHLELIFDGITFANKSNADLPIKPSPSGFGPCIGNYIFFERSVYGSEKHAYIYFSADDATVAEMRDLFLEFASQIPGKYQDTRTVTVPTPVD